MRLDQQLPCLQYRIFWMVEIQTSAPQVVLRSLVQLALPHLVFQHCLDVLRLFVFLRRGSGRATTSVDTALSSLDLPVAGHSFRCRAAKEHSQ